MLSNQTKDKFARLLRTLARSEQEIEESRQTLARNPSFETYTAFKRIDRFSDNSLSMNEVTDFLRENSVFASEKEVRTLFNAHSAGSVYLSYNDFQRIVLPRRDNTLRHKCLSRKVHALATDERLPGDVERALARFIQNEIDLLQKVENQKEDLSIKHDFNLSDAFNVVDEEKTGALSFEAIYNFLEKTQPVTKSDVEAILIRFDKNKDQLISYSEFSEIVEPTNPHYRVALRSPSPRRTASPQQSPRRTASPPRSARGNQLSESRYTSPIAKKNQADGEYQTYLRETAFTNNESRVTDFTKSLHNSNSSFFKESPIKRSDGMQSPLMSTKGFLSQVISPFKTETVKSFYSAAPIEQSKVVPAQTTRKYIVTSTDEGFEGLNTAEKKQLARFLKAELDLDRALEAIKKELALVRTYNAYTTFRTFDAENKGYITRGQLETGLESINIKPTKNELYLLMRRLDKDDDGLIRFSDFKEEIEPRNQAHKSISKVEDRDGEVSYEVRRVLRKLLNKTITNETSCDELRKSLGTNAFFSVFEAFTNMRKNCRGWITSKSVKDLFDEQGIYASEEDAELLIVRYDRNNDNKVSYSEFVDELTQKCF